MIFWALGFLTSAANLSVYLEYAAYFPNRSGSEVVYLEQAYPRPRWLFPTAFAFQSVALSFSSSNAIGECPGVLAVPLACMVKGRREEVVGLTDINGT